MKKGSSQSEKSVEQMKIAKHHRQLSLMDWSIIEPYLDVQIKNGSTNRTKQHITLRNYRDNMQSGITAEQMRKSGVSKHILQFMSNLCQGKITITKSQFEKEYLSGKGLDEICVTYNVTREDMTFLRQLYGVKRKGASYQNRKATEVALTQRQKEIIYGSLMGDGKKTSDSSVGFGHGGSQREYLMWKFNELYSVASKDSLKRYPYVDPRSGNKGESWRFYTHANSDIEEIVSQFYNGKKQITQTILDNLSILSIAVWFMDDGKTDFYYRTFNKGINHTPTCVFCTECFSDESCLLIQKWFKEKWNISVRLKEIQLKTRIGHRVIIENEDTSRFLALIKPYVLPIFLYKVDYAEYEKKRNAISSQNQQPISSDLIDFTI